MRVSLLIARSRLRRNVGATLALIVLAGLGGAVVMASLASIRRAEAGWQAFQADNPAADAIATVLTEDAQFPVPVDDDLEGVRSQVDALPGVEQTMRMSAIVAEVASSGSERGRLTAAELAMDPPIAGIQGEPILVAGRSADSTRPDETVINEEMADSLDVAVGDLLTVTPLTTAQLGKLEAGVEVRAAGAPAEVRVVGVTRAPSDVLGSRGEQQAQDNASLQLTPGWYRQNGPDLASYGVMLGIDLRDGSAGFDAVTAALAARFGERALVVPGTEFDQGIDDELRRGVEDRLRAEGRAQLAFAAVAALIAVLIFGQTLARQIAAESSDSEALSALGLTRGDGTSAAILRTVSVAVGGAVVAVVLAIGLSRYLPRGVGGRVQRDPGVAVDGWILAAGALGVMFVVLALAAVNAWRLGAARRRERPRRTVVADRVAAAGAGVIPTLGVRMAFDRSRASRAGQLSIAASTMAVATVVGAAVVLSSYGSLVHTPERFGQRWDMSFGNFSTQASVDDAVAFLEAREDVTSAAGELSADGTIHDRAVTVVAYAPAIGRMEPTVTSGRIPVGPGEVLLGETAAREIGLEIGDEIRLAIDILGPPQPVTVVGLGVAGTGLADPHPGRVAYLAPEALEGTTVELSPQNLLVELEPGADDDATAAALEAAYPDTVVRAPFVPRAVLLWDELSYVPVALAATVVALAAVALVNALVTSVRRRGRELAVVKALGARHRQIRGVVAWQATAWALASVLVGLPMGLVVGSMGWEAITTSLGLHSALAVPFLLVGVVVFSIVGVANLIALLPARTAASIPAATALRIE